MNQTFVQNPLPDGYRLTFNPSVRHWTLKTDDGYRFDFRPAVTYGDALAASLAIARQRSQRR